MNPLTRSVMNHLKAQNQANFKHWFQRSQFTSTSQKFNQLERLQKVKELRPRSPWTAYKFPLNAILSITHRVTGVGLGLGFYAVAIAYPAIGLTSDKAVALVQQVPDSVKFAAKLIIAFPFMLHTCHGLRHLVWDTATSLTNKSIFASNYLVLGVSAVSSLALASA